MIWLVGLGIIGLGLAWLICAVIAENRRAYFQRELRGDQFTRERLERLARMQRQERL